uniref:Microsomal glutathione S-transferase 1 n=1 Tax=Cacopsylla melanoneura TaxID=428564 RepID=A0A8D8QM62_9HEMI
MSVPPLFRPASENLFRPAGSPGEGLQFQDIIQDPSSGSTMAEELSNSFEGPTLLTGTNVVFQCYAFYAALLVLKMIVVAFMTVGTRVKKKVFVTPEDTNLNGGVVAFDDPDVERMRRAHLNDLENIPTFLIICLLYIMTDPGTMLACWLIRIFTLARFLHTFVYTIYVLPQPSRAISFLTGVFIQIFMAGVVIMNYAHAY